MVQIWMQGMEAASNNKSKLLISFPSANLPGNEELFAC